MKKVAFILILLLSITAVNAQKSKVGQFITPMTENALRQMYSDVYDVNNVLTKKMVSTVKIRPAMSGTFIAIKPVFDENWKFQQFDIQPASRVGFGGSVVFYKPLETDSIMFAAYSIDLLVTIAGQNGVANSGVLLTFSAFDLWGLKPSLGPGLDVIPGTPFKSWWYAAFNIRYEF